MAHAVMHGRTARASPFWTRYTHTRATLVAVVSVAYGAVLLLNIVTLLTPPRLSLALAMPAAGRAQVAWVLPGSTLWEDGVRQGDRVLAIDGHAPTLRDAGIWTGERVLVSTGMGTTTAVDAAEIGSGRTTWPLLVLSPWFILLGTLVVLRALRPNVGRATYALFASAAFALALAPAADADQPIPTVVEFAMVAVFAACWVHFFLVFPTPRGRTLLRALLLAPPLAGIMLGLAALVWPDLYEPAYLLRIAVLLCYLLGGIGLLVFSFVTANERDTRRGLTIISAGAVASILLFATLFLAPTVLHRPPPMSAEHAILALALLPASFAYAILRHNVLNVHLLQRWLVRGVLWGALLALYVAVVYARNGLPGAVLPEPGYSVALAGVLVALAGGAFWLRGQVQRFLDRLIFKDTYDYRASLQQLSRDLSLAGDLDTLGTALPGTLRRLMNLDFAVLLIHDERGISPCGGAGAYRPAMLPALAAATQQARDLPRVVHLAAGAPPVLLIALRTHDVLVGHLCLGPKASGEPFRGEDRALLATLSGHLAAILRNVQLVDDLRAKVALLEAQKAALDALNERLQHAQEEERARLAADLHDEPLQTALRLQRSLIVDGRHDAAHHIALGDALVDQLRAICTAVRPAVLHELGLAAALEVLALELGTHSGVPILLDADPELKELALRPAIDLVLYRAAQEALHNALRHARPTGIQITLRREARTVRLRVADDGAGFAVPDHMSALVAAGHLGLAGMHRRVQRAGGQFCVTSMPGQGTVVEVVFASRLTEGAAG